MTTVDDVLADLTAAADPGRAAVLRRYLRTGPGEYGEGDRILGVPVPTQRAVAARHWRAATLDDARALLASPWHEARLTGVFVLVRRFDKGDAAQRRAIFDLVLASSDRINNWDLVDTAAPKIVGPWLLEREAAGEEPAAPVLDRLAASALVWDRRIAVMATFAFTRAGRFGPTLALARRLLGDPHDLVHKAVGWMLREVGKRDRAALEAFLGRHQRQMPRVMLRYAIEQLPAERRRAYLSGTAGAATA